ncbi:hypothetical protein K402DRAFT_393256, partial [Aulographum hederae CBS 113979]
MTSFHLNGFSFLSNLTTTSSAFRDTLCPQLWIDAVSTASNTEGAAILQALQPTDEQGKALPFRKICIFKRPPGVTREPLPLTFN